MMKKILILPQFGLGDTLLFTPMLKVLKNVLPDSYITCITMKKSNYDLLLNNPNIDNLEFYPFLENKFGGLLHIIKNYAFKYDYTISPFPSNRKEYNIFSFLTFSKNRIGHRYIKDDFISLNWLKNLSVKEDKRLHCVEENLRLLSFLNIQYNQYNDLKLEIFLNDEEIAFGKDFVSNYSNKKIKVGIHPGSSRFKNQFNRRLPAEKWIQVINHFDYIDFFVFGTEEEKEEINFIMKNKKYDNVIVCDGLTIRQVASIIKNLNIFMSNDSGLMHLSAAVQTPVIAIFGYTNPNRVRPWNVKHKIIYLNLDCSPCFNYSPKEVRCVKNIDFACIKNIEADRIINELKNFIEELKIE